MLARGLDALAARQADNAVNVQPLVGNDTRGSLNLPGLQLSAQHHQNVAALALMAHPVFVLVVADG